MRDTLKTLLQIRDEGLLAEFAIGGAIAASCYTPAVATEDLDIFAFFKPSASGHLVLAPIDDRLRQLGGRIENEYVVIGKWPVQILPAYTPLVEEAVLCALDRAFEDLTIRVVNADYLSAIALQTDRPKDYLRIHSLIESGHVQSAKLAALVNKFGLASRWEIYVQRYA